MPRYFIELSYRGTAYSGFQSQHNANTIQAEVEKAIRILRQEPLVMIGSSRTDTGVHALKNYFHVDTILPFGKRETVYKLNAILPRDISIRDIILVSDDAHCRFDAIGREYRYYIHQAKEPFLDDRSFYFPYRLDIEKMQVAADMIRGYSDFTSFSKRNTQVKTFTCVISESRWEQKEGGWYYKVRGNRFLRGMVRALTATMLKVGRGRTSVEEFVGIVEAKDCTKASFAVPAHGLFLIGVEYPVGYFNDTE